MQEFYVPLIERALNKAFRAEVARIPWYLRDHLDTELSLSQNFLLHRYVDVVWDVIFRSRYPFDSQDGRAQDGTGQNTTGHNRTGHNINLGLGKVCTNIKDTFVE